MGSGGGEGTLVKTLRRPAAIVQNMMMLPEAPFPNESRTVGSTHARGSLSRSTKSSEQLCTYCRKLACHQRSITTNDSTSSSLYCREKDTTVVPSGFVPKNTVAAARELRAPGPLAERYVLQSAVVAGA